jgi:hypothetical protein
LKELDQLGMIYDYGILPNNNVSQPNGEVIREAYMTRKEAIKRFFVDCSRDMKFRDS